MEPTDLPERIFAAYHTHCKWAQKYIALVQIHRQHLHRD